MEIINFNILTVTDIILLVSLLGVFFIQVYFLLAYYLKLALHKKEVFNPETNHISMILQVRNEEEKIRELMYRFTELPFNDYEVIVINENSEDNTLQLLNILAETNPRIKVTGLSQETRFSDKQAINIGLKGASFSWIVQISSFSGTIHPDWLMKLNGLLDKNTDAVIAYTNVAKAKGFRNLLCRLERFNQFMVSGAWTLAGKPFVFQENNILFRKSMYFETQGFKHKLNRNFANLELIFNEKFAKGNVKISTNPDLVIREEIEDDRGDHIKLFKKTVQIRQSIRWSYKISLFTDDLTKMALLGIPVAFIILHPEYWITISSIILIYFILVLIIVKKLLMRLNERNIFVSSFAYFLMKPIINWWYFWSLYLLHRRSRWN